MSMCGGASIRNPGTCSRPPPAHGTRTSAPTATRCRPRICGRCSVAMRCPCRAREALFDARATLGGAPRQAFEHGAMLVAALLVAESSLPLLRPGDGAPRARAGLMIRRTGRLPLPALRSRAGRFPVSELAAKRAIRPAQAAIALQELLIALADGTTGAGVRAHARVPRLHPGLQRLPSPTPPGRRGQLQRSIDALAYPYQRRF